MTAPNAHAPGAYRDELAGQWQPNSAPLDAHEVPFEAGEAPSTGPTPTNIQIDAPGEGYDFGAARSADGLDGSDDPHDADTVDASDGKDDCNDCGPVAPNIQV